MKVNTGYMEIKYHVKDDKFETFGDLKKKAMIELVEEFLRLQVGQGEDLVPPRDLDTYTIRLKWYPENDGIEVVSNTGNRGLRDGILMEFLKRK